jgi:hypothetical protein
MANDNERLPVTVYIQIRDGVMNRVGSFEIEVAYTRPLKDKDKIHPDARLDHAVRKTDLAAALRHAAFEIENEGVRRV